MDKRAGKAEAGRSKERTAARNGKLRAFHLALGILGVLASVAVWLVVALIPLNVGHYVACFYMLMAEPGVFLPNLLSMGCLNVFVVTSVAFSLYTGVYHLIVVGLIMFNEYVNEFQYPNYHNHYRWIFRACVIPTFYAVALHVSGARELITIVSLMLMAILVEILHWIVESKITYGPASSGDYKLVVSKRVLTAHYAALVFAVILALAQLAYFIAYIVQSTAAVPLITWLYGPLFFVYYLGFALWWYSEMTAATVPRDSRLSTEYLWSLYDFVLLLTLTAMSTLGAILS